LSGCFDELRFSPARFADIRVVNTHESSLSRALRNAGAKPLEEMAAELAAGQLISVALDDNDHEPWMMSLS